MVSRSLDVDEVAKMRQGGDRFERYCTVQYTLLEAGGLRFLCFFDFFSVVFWRKKNDQNN